MGHLWSQRVHLLLVKDAQFDSTVTPSFGEGVLRLHEVDNLAAGLEQVWSRSPDLLLLESRERPLAAVAFCCQLRPFFQVPLLVVEYGVGEAQRIALLDSGADDVVPSVSSYAELLARFNALLRRIERQQRRDPHAHYLRAANMELDISGRRLLLPGRQVDLPLSLVKLLAILFVHYDAFVSREAIAQHVFGTATPAAQARISALVNLLRRRVEQELSLPPLVVSVMGRGYRLAELPAAAVRVP